MVRMRKRERDEQEASERRGACGRARHAAVPSWGLYVDRFHGGGERRRKADRRARGKAVSRRGTEERLEAETMLSCELFCCAETRHTPDAGQ
jgi:hypothetical protein